MLRTEVAARHEAIDRFVAERTPNFVAPSVTAISPELTRDNGIKVLMLDVEGTILPQGGLDPDPQVLVHLDRLREEGGVEEVVLGTNKKIRTPASYITLAHWGAETGAALVMTPPDSSWRKPRPRMITEAADRLGHAPHEVMMVGDKLTADVRAGNAAGAHTVWITPPVGGKDLVGDRVFRRPYEQLIASRHSSVTLLDGIPEYDAVDYPEIEHTSSFDNINWWGKEIPDELLAIDNNIFGYGIEYDGPKPDRTLGSRWLYENGGDLGDLMTDLRPLFKAAGAVLERDSPHVAASMKAIGSITDILDGWLVRHSRRGPTKDGARKDEQYDKIARTISEVGMFLSGKLAFRHLRDRTMADLAMNEVRGGHVRNGGDGSSVLPGKLATLIVDVADVASPVLARNHPIIAASLDEIATAAKVARIPGNMHFMQRREEERSRLAPQYAAMAERLTLTI